MDLSSSEAHATALFPDTVAMRKLGVLTPADFDAAEAQYTRLSAGLTADAVLAYGNDLGRATTAYTDQLLDEVRAADLGANASLIAELADCAAAADLQALGGKRSKVPVVGPLIDRAMLTRRNVATRLASVQGQVNGVVDRIEETRTRLKTRIARYNEMGQNAIGEFRTIGIHIAAGERALLDLQVRLDQLAEPAGPLDRIEQDEQRRVAELLEKRVADLRLAQHSTLQAVPMFTMQATNDAKLADKLASATSVAVPLLKRQLVLAAGLAAQKQDVDLTDTIDGVVNEVLKGNSELLKANSIRAARASQRTVVDIKTLEEVQASLIETQREISAIQTEGAKERTQIATTVARLQKELADGIARHPAQAQLSGHGSPLGTAPKGSMSQPGPS